MDWRKKIVLVILLVNQILEMILVVVFCRKFKIELRLNFNEKIYIDIGIIV